MGLTAQLKRYLLYPPRDALKQSVISFWIGNVLDSDPDGLAGQSNDVIVSGRFDCDRVRFGCHFGPPVVGRRSDCRWKKAFRCAGVRRRSVPVILNGNSPLANFCRVPVSLHFSGSNVTN